MYTEEGEAIRFRDDGDPAPLHIIYPRPLRGRLRNSCPPFPASIYVYELFGDG